MEFPEDFVWGAAAASYQIEGAYLTDGKGLSVWDVFCRRQGAVYEGHTGDVACDHYRRFAHDVALMRDIGLRAYRFSIGWPRVLPEGVGAVNRAGLDFYSRLVDALLGAGIQPYATLFHWDYPLALFRRGGWLHSDSPAWFAEYAHAIVSALGDRVKHWITLNEPQVFIGSGHHEGRHAPGLTLPFSEVLLASHHVLLAHGRGVLAIRAASQGPCEVGWAPVGMVRYPLSDAEADVAAARSESFRVTRKDVWSNAWWMDPVYLGEYPSDGMELFAEDVPSIAGSDMATIHQPLDFFGVNVYQGQPVRANQRGEAVAQPFSAGFPRTAFDWPVTPEALRWGPRFFFERYGLPILITENGLSCRDWPALDGKIHDGARIDFTARYLRALASSRRDGTKLKGYFHWSILDNFEWAEGYKQRFGLVHVDYETQLRTPKESAWWYKRVIESNGKALSEPNGP